ncbi:MAG: type III-B CRISPR module RAMP protein Cmr1 [Campylobacterales bacterium]
MNEIKASFRIVTPMFLGDANSSANDGLRPPSIKGVLRYWWRALNWQVALERSNHDHDRALEWLHDNEARLFGATATEVGGGQGVFLMQIEATQPIVSENNKNLLENKPGLQYLAGQGLYNYRDKLLRNYIKPGQSFTLMLRFKPKTTQEDITSIKQALLLFGLIGGVGARSRRGFGSITIEKLDNEKIPNNVNEYIHALQQLIGNPTTDLPPFTAFSSQSRIDISKKGTDIISVHDEIGRELQLYRSYGKDGKVNGKSAERNFKDDHDLILNFAKNNSLTRIPRRTVFGLPHNYFFSSTRYKVDYFPPDQDNKEGRRASPLFIHLHQFPDKSVIGVQLLLPATFLPSKKKLTFKKDRNDKKNIDFTNVDWSIVKRYLDRFTSAQRILG